MFNGSTIAESSTINIVGVTIEQKLNWSEHIHNVLQEQIKGEESCGE